MKKKIGIVILLFLVIAFGCFSNVFAADNSDGGEIGINNLNNTIENSAKVGDQLTHPEIGWKRYDDTDKRIQYKGDGWNSGSSDRFYDGSAHYNNNLSSNIYFEFFGTKLRIIPYANYTWSKKVQITIDNSIVEYMNMNGSGRVTQTICYEKKGLTEGKHTVKLNIIDDGYMGLDAIDIDSTGYLIDPSSEVAVTGVSLNKTTDNLTVGQTDTLTASVTPDNASNKNVTWKSSDDSIVSVDKNGKITALKAGTATVTAVTQDGSNLSASCTVNVTEKTSPTQPTNPTGSGDKATLNITMTNGQVKQYNVTMDVVNKFISWYKLRSAGSGDPFSIFDITQASQSDIKRTDYVVFDKISSFEVDDYTK